jgi:hypothetical protein
VSDGASYDVAGPLVSSDADGHTLRALGGETVLASGGLGLLIEVAYDYPYVDEGNTATLLMDDPGVSSGSVPRTGEVVQPQGGPLGSFPSPWARHRHADVLPGVGPEVDVGFEPSSP